MLAPCSVETSDPTGSPAKPLSDARLAEKFRDCAGRAARPVQADALIDFIMRLDRLADLRPIQP